MYGLEQATQSAETASPAPAAAASATPTCEVVFNGRQEWQAGFQQHLLPLQCSPLDPLAFKCNAVVAQLCGNTVADLRVDASRLARREADLERGGAELVKVLWQLAGRSRIRQGRNSATLEPGAWTLVDAGREYLIELEHSARCQLMLVPRSQCTGWLAGMEALSALALSTRGPAQIARTILGSLVRDRTPLDGRSERALHDAVIALVDHALQIELAARGLSAQTRRGVDFSHVQAYVMDRVADKALTVDRVAAAFGMSRRSLYNLFAPIGVTPHTFIQHAKLARARTLLSDPEWRDAPIVRIAEHCGFADAAHFSRTFHAHHGAAPNAWRGRS